MSFALAVYGLHKQTVVERGDAPIFPRTGFTRGRCTISMDLRSATVRPFEKENDL